MKKKLFISISIALLISACAEINDNAPINNKVFVDFERLNKTSIYYRNDHIRQIPTGEQYWQNKLQQANNQLEQAVIDIEIDLNQDLNRLSSIDNDMDALVRCRTIQRDVIKQQYADGKLTLSQAGHAWKKWADLVRQDHSDMQYLNEVLANTQKIEQSYRTATSEIASALPPVSQDTQQLQLQTQKNNDLARAEKTYKKSLAKKHIKPKAKKALIAQHQQKIAEINQQYAIKEANIKQIEVNAAPIEPFEVTELKQKLTELDQQQTLKQDEIKRIEIKKAEIKKIEAKQLKQKMAELNQQQAVKQAEIKNIEVKKAEIKQFKATELKQKMAELDQQYALKKAEIQNIQINKTDIKKAELTMLKPKVDKLKLLVSSVHEKYESIQKSKEKLDKLAAEANNDKGFEQITSQLFPILFAHLDALRASFAILPRRNV